MLGIPAYLLLNLKIATFFQTFQRPKSELWLIVMNPVMNPDQVRNFHETVLLEFLRLVICTVMAAKQLYGLHVTCMPM